MGVRHGLTVFRSVYEVRVLIDPAWEAPAAPRWWEDVDWGHVVLWGIIGGALGLCRSFVGRGRLGDGWRLSMVRSRGWGPWRCDWYSICSRHGRWRSDCPLCQSGQWVNRWARVGGGIVCRVCPRFLVWWVNRPNSKTRRWLRSVFPNLR